MKKIGSLLILFLGFSQIFSEGFTSDPYSPNLHAFTMLGDSRTHFMKMPYNYIPNNAGMVSNWHDEPFLGAYSSKIAGVDSMSKIQNIAIGGTKAAEWKVLCLANQSPCNAEQMAKRVVIMVGGNDVKDRSKEWIAQFGSNRDAVKNQILNQIHNDVKIIVTTLVLKGKEVIIQGHFRTNPAYNDIQHIGYDEGLMGLRQRLEDDFNPHWVVTKPGKFYIKGWRSICGWLGWCPFCFFGCIPIPIVVWQAPVFEIKGVFPNTSYAFLPTDFPAAYFADDLHLNTQGYIYHSSHLVKSLSGRGWW
jgi:lysophospholipase L1-like esterase